MVEIPNDAPTSSPVTPQEPIRQRRSPAWLVIVGLGLLLEVAWLEHGFTSVSLFHGVFVGSLLVASVGLAGFARATHHSFWWGLFGLIPFAGPPIVIGALGVEWLLFRITGKPAVRTLTLPLLGLGGVASFIVFLVSFSSYQPRSPQSEARTNLGMIYVAEGAFLYEKGRYGTFEEIGFTLVGKSNRYTYRIDASGKPGTIFPAGQGQPTPENTVVPSGFSPTGFTATATGNIDGDPTIDQWHVNDVKCCLQQVDVNDADR